MGDEVGAVLGWALAWGAFCVAFWTPLWLWVRSRRLRSGRHPARPPRAVLAFNATALLRLWQLCVAWWLGRLGAAFLFPSGFEHWFSAGLLSGIVIFLADRIGLIGENVVAFEEHILALAGEAPWRWARRELIVLGVSLLLLLAVGLLLPFAPTVEESASWSVWNWCGRWLLLTSSLTLLSYAISHNWRLARRILHSRGKRLLYLFLLAPVVLMQTSIWFEWFGLWWLARSLAELFFSQGPGSDATAAGFCVLYLRLAERTSPLRLYARYITNEFVQVSSALLRGGLRAFLLQLAIVLVTAAALVLLDEGLSRKNLGAVAGVILLFGVIHWASWRLLPARPRR